MGFRAESGRELPKKGDVKITIETGSEKGEPLKIRVHAEFANCSPLEMEFIDSLKEWLSDAAVPGSFAAQEKIVTHKSIAEETLRN